ncbi:hypothetical protein GH714_026531 [Hevea brasiliensis]|uniref:GST N-terminal domain-containing protein n=1 Tax=Hevea brasiliensis TaxID=3981 RepID=A0A6A6N6R7_HEVBR|nr:hypothetical protein GH714_026531 [Hevea brasiliensis]
MEEEVKLFRIWLSPYSLTVVCALKLKGIAYEAIYEDLSNKSPSLVKHNHVHRKIPVLLHNGNPVCESLFILEYMDKTWKQTPLLAEDPHQKAMARFWVRFGEDNVLRSIRFGVLLTEGKEQLEATLICKT